MQVAELKIRDDLDCTFCRRRARPMSNGTSDGEEHSTQDSDSQTSGSSSKQAALTRALELLPTAQAVKDQEEETLNVS